MVTGGTKGLGKELVELFRNSGDIVLSLARSANSESDFEYVCDVSDENQVKEIIKDIAKRFGKIDLLINNAGFGLSGITELISSEKAKQIFDVNFFGCFYLSKYALPYMPKGSRIVNIGSAMEMFPVPYRAFYASSKSALGTLSLTQRMECKQLGVDVALVCPGDVKTSFTQNRVKEFETNERYGDSIKRATLKLDSREDKRMDAKKVAHMIFKICNKKKTKPRYTIGAKYKFLDFVCRFAPLSLKLKFISKICG